MGFERAFATLFGQDVQTFTDTMILNLDQLQQQLEQGEYSKIGSIFSLCVINKKLQVFINSKFTMDYDYDSLMTQQCFADHTRIEVDTFRDTLLQLMGNVKEFIEERAQHKLMYDDKVKACRVKSCDGIVDSGIASDVGSVVTECKGSETDKLDTTRSSVILVTHDMDADFRPVKEHVSCAKVPLTDQHNLLDNEQQHAEVPLTDQHNVLDNERQHTDQIKPTYDTNLLKKIDSNTISNSTNMSHKGG